MWTAEEKEKAGQLAEGMFIGTAWDPAVRQDCDERGVTEDLHRVAEAVLNMAGKLLAARAGGAHAKRLTTLMINAEAMARTPESKVSVEELLWVLDHVVRQSARIAQLEHLLVESGRATGDEIVLTNSAASELERLWPAASTDVATALAGVPDSSGGDGERAAVHRLAAKAKVGEAFAEACRKALGSQATGTPEDVVTLGKGFEAATALGGRLCAERDEWKKRATEVETETARLNALERSLRAQEVDALLMRTVRQVREVLGLKAPAQEQE